MDEVRSGAVTVQVRIPAALRQTTAGQATVGVRLGGGDDGGAGGGGRVGDAGGAGAGAGGAGGAGGGGNDGGGGRAGGGSVEAGDAEVAADPIRGGPHDVRAVLDVLRTSHADLERRVRDEQGALRRHVNVFVGSTNIRDLDEQATVLADGDEIAILPAVSGG